MDQQLMQTPQETQDPMEYVGLVHHLGGVSHLNEIPKAQQKSTLFKEKQLN